MPAPATDDPAPKVKADSSAHRGASLDDRTLLSWTPAAGSADADLLPELDVLVPRARDLARNNGLAASGHQTLKDNIVGSVLRLSAQPDYRLLGRDRPWARAWADRTEPQFRSWAETPECDAGRSMTLLGLTTQAMGGALLNGEALALPLWLPRPGSPWATRLMLIEADRLGTPPERSGDPTLRGGVEIDRYGAPLAYWIRKQHPGDLYAGWYRPDIAEYERVPAFTPWGRRRVLHLHDKERTGQSRGKPLVTAVMREFRMAGEYATTELQSAVANALIAAFLESNLDTESAAALFGSGQDQNPESYWKQAIGEYRATLRGGAVIPLPAGARLASFTPSRPNTGFADFMAAVLRHIAAGLNLPYELLVKDFSKTNYSSARAALLEAWRHFQSKRRSLIDYWLLPIYQLWLEEAVNRARVEAPGYYDNRYAYARARWIFAGRGWVDPVKEANAAKIRMAASLSTLEAECAEQGLDWQEVLEQRAAEKDMAKRLGLDLNTDVTPDARPEASEPEET